eukprot:scaffold17880_cov27-Tisochrysis_lutea.AAC.1
MMSSRITSSVRRTRLDLTAPATLAFAAAAAAAESFVSTDTMRARFASDSPCNSFSLRIRASGFAHALGPLVVHADGEAQILFFGLSMAAEELVALVPLSVAAVGVALAAGAGAVAAAEVGEASAATRIGVAADTRPRAKLRPEFPQPHDLLRPGTRVALDQPQTYRLRRGQP